MKQIIKIILLPIIPVIAFGCGGDRNTYPVPVADAGADSVVMETKSFKIGSEKYTADFGTITVQENRGNSTSRLINIPFLRIHSHAMNPAEPIFGFAGGPGQSNMTWGWEKAWTFLSRHDFVLVGYRGVDGSTVLDCPEVTEALKKNEDPLSEESLKSVGHAWTAAAARLESQAIDLDSYTMLDVIEDNESVRKALGYNRIDLLSESYGTRVAYLYGLRHPKIMFRSAMISVNPPGHFVWEARMTDAQLRQYSTIWSRDSAMIRKSPDLYATMSKVLSSMPENWLFFNIDPGKVRVVTFALLFHRATAAMVFDSYVAAERGDPSGLALMSTAYDYVVPSLATWGDMACKAVSADFDSTLDYAEDMDSSKTPLGSPMTALLWGPLSYGHWPMKLVPEEFRKPRRSEVRTLLLSGSVDFSTPPDFARNELLPFLPNGRQVILSECGHVNDVWYTNISNTRLILTSFYDTGTPDASLNSYVPMAFAVKWGFPLIARIAVGGIAFVVIALGMVALWIIKRHRKRQASRNLTSPDITAIRNGGSK